MAATVARESDSSTTAHAPRRRRRVLLWSLAVVAILYFTLSASVALSVLLGIAGNGLLFAFPVLALVMLFQYFSGRTVTVGWVVGSTLCGALVACISAPKISHSPLNDLWATQHAFWGAVVGMTGGAVVCLLVVRARIRIRHLLELTVACGLVAMFWTFYSEAHARNESWNESIRKLSLGPPMPFDGSASCCHRMSRYSTSSPPYYGGDGC